MRMSTISHEDGTSTKRKRACVECRQQKARCDAHLHDNRSCSRCRRLNLDCIISEPFKRENKRQKLAELRDETQELREQLKRLNDPTPFSANAPSLMPLQNATSRGLTPITGPNPTFGPPPNARTYADGLNSDVAQMQQVSPQPTHQSQLESRSGTSTLRKLENDTAIEEATLPRTLDGYTLTSKEIYEMFVLFFNHYAIHLPIFDSSKSPNTYYEESPLLFWCMVGVACRTYDKNPVLLAAMQPRVHNLICDSLKFSPSLENVQALLLLVSWPFPRRQLTESPTFNLCGALLHTAMGIGLHVPAASQEYSRVKLTLTEEDIKQRAETWAFCIVIYQRTSLNKGVAILSVQDVCQDPLQRELLLRKLSPDTSFQLQLQDTVARCCKVLSQTGLQELSSDHERVFDLMIKTHKVEINNARITAVSRSHSFFLSLADLVVEAFHLFRSPTTYEATSIVRIFGAANTVVEALNEILVSSAFELKACPLYHTFALLLSSQVLLRLYKMPSLSQHIDIDVAKRMICLAINISKAMSLENDDLASRSAEVLTQTIDSRRAFKDPHDEYAPVELRVRTRFVMGIVLDGLIWWREEFGGNTGIYPVPLKSNNSQTTSPGTLRTEPVVDLTNVSTTGGPAPTVPDMSMYDFDTFLTDTGWAGFEDIFPPIY